jgi:predicted transcriptional regulator
VKGGQYFTVSGTVGLDLPGGIREVLMARDVQVKVESDTPSWDMLEFTDLQNDGSFEALVKAPEKAGKYKVKVTVGISPLEKSETAVVEVKEEKTSFIAAQPVTFTAAVVSLGAIASCAAVGGTDLGRYKFFTFMLPLFTRLKKAKVLDHFDRGRIFEYITKNPGAHYSEIKTNLDLNNGALAYHLKVLEREEYVKGRSFGMYRRFFPFGFKIKIERYVSIQELITGLVDNKPGLGQKDMAKTLGVPRSTVNYHCNLLVRSGKIRSSKKGRKKRYYVK